MSERSLADWLDGASDEPAPAGPSDAASVDDRWGRQPPGRRPTVLWVLAVVPWVVVAVGFLALRGGDEPSAPPAGPGAPAAGLPDAAGADGSQVPGAGAHAGSAGGERLAGGEEPGLPGSGAPQAGAPEGPGGPDAAWGPDVAERPDASASAGAPIAAPDPTLAGAGLAAVHLAVSGRDAEGAERYVEHAVVEEVVHLDADTALVTVLAVVLDGAEGTWRERRPARYAVPVGPGPVIRGTPWPLPAPAVDETARPPGSADVEPALHDAVAGALVEAGYVDVEVTAVERLAGSLLRASVTAAGPGAPVPTPLEPWLTAGPPPRLLGAPDAPTTAEPPATPSETETRSTDAP